MELQSNIDKTKEFRISDKSQKQEQRKNALNEHHAWFTISRTNFVLYNYESDNIFYQ